MLKELRKKVVQMIDEDANIKDIQPLLANVNALQDSYTDAHPAYPTNTKSI